MECCHGRDDQQLPMRHFTAEHPRQRRKVLGSVRSADLIPKQNVPGLNVRRLMGSGQDAHPRKCSSACRRCWGKAPSVSITLGTRTQGVGNVASMSWDQGFSRQGHAAHKLGVSVSGTGPGALLETRWVGGRGRMPLTSTLPSGAYHLRERHGAQAPRSLQV